MSVLDDLRIYDRRGSAANLDRTREYAQSIGYKPSGLWVSVGDDWDRWCRDEEKEWTTDVPVISVDLTDDAADRLLVLDTEQVIRDFPTTCRDGQPRWNGYIDWPTIAEQYAGIVIAPYQWGARLDVMWYYGWDCASGCIWDLSVVERTRLTETAEAAS